MHIYIDARHVQHATRDNIRIYQTYVGKYMLMTTLMVYMAFYAFKCIIHYDKCNVARNF